MATQTSSIADLAAAYEAARDVLRPFNLRVFADLSDAEKAQVQALRAAATAAYQELLAAQCAAAAAYGFRVAGALAYCPTCEQQMHVEGALTHVCCAYCKRALTTPAETFTATGLAIHLRCAGRWQQQEEHNAQLSAAVSAGYKVLAARFAGVCAGCGVRFAAGSEIAWQQRSARHLACVDAIAPAAAGVRTCRYCGEDETFGGYLCPMSRDGEQPHRFA